MNKNTLTNFPVHCNIRCTMALVSVPLWFAVTIFNTVNRRYVISYSLFSPSSKTRTWPSSEGWFMSYRGVCLCLPYICNSFVCFRCDLALTCDLVWKYSGSVNLPQLENKQACKPSNDRTLTSKCRQTFQTKTFSPSRKWPDDVIYVRCL